MWRHHGVTADKRSDASRALLLIRGAAKKPAKKLPPMSLDKNTLKSTDVDVASGGHLVAKALKTEGVWILISALAGRLSLKISFLSSRNAFRANHPTVDAC
jgi:hypothetical protein